MSGTKANWKTCPSAWFVELEAALQREDFEAAEEATRRLQRLGVDVRWMRLPRHSRKKTEEMARTTDQ